MIELAFIILAGIVGCLVQTLKVRPMYAWLVGTAVIPVFLVIAEFAWEPTHLRYSGHIAGPVCMFLFIAGALASAAGVGVAKCFPRGK